MFIYWTLAGEEYLGKDILGVTFLVYFGEKALNELLKPFLFFLQKKKIFFFSIFFIFST